MTETQLWEESPKMVEREISKYNIRGSIQLLTYLDPFSQKKYYQTSKPPTTLVRKLAASGRIFSWKCPPEASGHKIRGQNPFESLGMA